MSNIIRIEFDRTTGDYTAYVDDQPIGCATTDHAAEMKARAVVFSHTAKDQHGTQLNAKIAMFSNAHKAAKTDGRLQDAARYKREGALLIAQKYGLSEQEAA